MSTWSKKCGCCPRVYTVETWKTLPYVGVQTFDDGGPDLEYRNCVCGTTLVSKPPASDVADEAA